MNALEQLTEAVREQKIATIRLLLQRKHNQRYDLRRQLVEIDEELNSLSEQLKELHGDTEEVGMNVRVDLKSYMKDLEFLLTELELKIR